MNPQQIAPVIGLTITIGGILFQSGKQSERLDFVFGKVEAQEQKVSYNNDSLIEIKGDLKTLTNDVAAIKQDVRDMKNRLNQSKV